jgi:hypothetical protein
LNLYQDTTSKGTWHYCFDCKSFGELLELVAKVWKLDILSTVQKLEAAGISFPPNTEKLQVETYYIFPDADKECG